MAAHDPSTMGRRGGSSGEPKILEIGAIHPYPWRDDFLMIQLAVGPTFVSSCSARVSFIFAPSCLKEPTSSELCGEQRTEQLSLELLKMKSGMQEKRIAPGRTG